MTRLCEHLIIYHQGRQCFHKLPQPGAACAGINSRLLTNIQLLITTGKGGQPWRSGPWTGGEGGEDGEGLAPLL